MKQPHAYSIDTDKRTRLKIYFAIFGAMVGGLLSALKTDGRLPQYLSVPTAATLYGLLFLIFDNWGWKWQWVRAWSISQIPDLNGKWEGTIESTWNGGGPPTKATLTIKQTWTKIGVHLRTEHSESNSHVAALATEAVEGTVLTYVYYNTVNQGNMVESMADHPGTACLVHRADPVRDSLDGGYYSGRGRQNHGKLVFSRSVD